MARWSGEDDLASGREVIELSDRDDVFDLVDQVCLGQPEQVGGCLAAIQPGADYGAE
ncbi:MAG TPA: hypothetical protein VK280_12755 [Streptosporangiaceae bacterium]|nr:hypothetical protein [Streptosporangiaceae bacterium]